MAVDNLIQIKAPHFCAGVVFARISGIWTVTEAAPIVKYMQGWCAAKVKAYIAKKGWEAAKVV